MSSTYTGNPASGARTPAIAITEPADLDALSAASVNVALSKLADYVAYLQANAVLLSNASRQINAIANGVAATDVASVGQVASAISTALAPSAWATLSLAANWTQGGAGFTADYSKLLDTVRVRGMVTASTGASAIIGTLPAGFRPANTLYFVCAGAPGGSVGSFLVLNVSTAGVISITYPSTGTGCANTDAVLLSLSFPTT